MQRLTKSKNVLSYGTFIDRMLSFVATVDGSIAIEVANEVRACCVRCDDPLQLREMAEWLTAKAEEIEAKS
jgi:hypothetical protein